MTGGRKAILAEIEHNGFPCAPCVDSTPRSTFRHVTAGDVAPQVDDFTLHPDDPDDNLILLFADLAELAEDPAVLGERSAPR